jgi:hypothetical protein
MPISSDSISHSYQNRESIRLITKNLQEVVQNLRNLGYTIGGSIIFPCKKIDRKMTINGARGFNAKIADRFDLTLECIRRHYLSERNPLEDTLNRYTQFFKLFGSFRNYVDFFMLQDLVSSDYKKINLYIHSGIAFETSPLPNSAREYIAYAERNIEFLESRNARISEIDFSNKH